jgi:hypothetical protein
MLSLRTFHRQLLCGALLLTAGAAAVLAQEAPAESTLIRTKTGVLLVHNEAGLNFTLALTGKDIQPMDSQDHIFVKIDGRVTQLHTVSIAEFAPELKDRKLNDWLLLERHRDWEADYIGNALGTKVKVTSEVLTLNQNRPALFWSFPVPAEVDKQTKSQLYLTVVSGKQVIMINCAVQTNDYEALVRKFMIEAMNTLKLSDKAIDVQAVQEAIRKGIM